MKAVHIRKAVWSDLSAIKQLFFETITTVNKNDYTPAQIAVWSSGVSNDLRWKQKFSQQHFFVAEIDRRIVGFTSLFKNNYVDYMYVSHLHLRKGIASKLLQACIDLATSNNTKQLRSDVSITALPFFEKKGFLVVSKNKNEHLGEILINFNVIYTIP